MRQRRLRFNFYRPAQGVCPIPELHPLQHLPDGEPLAGPVEEKTAKILLTEVVGRHLYGRRPGPVRIAGFLPLLRVHPAVCLKQDGAVPCQKKNLVDVPFPGDAADKPAVARRKQSPINKAVFVLP